MLFYSRASALEKRLTKKTVNGPLVLVETVRTGWIEMQIRGYDVSRPFTLHWKWERDCMNGKVQYSLRQSSTQLCKTSDTTTHLHLAGMLCMCTRSPSCFRLILQPWILPTCCTNIHVYSCKLTCKRDPTRLTGHRVNTTTAAAPGHSTCSLAVSRL